MTDEPRFWPQPFVAGVSLTYDGATEEQLDRLVPLLDRFNLRATFFGDPIEFVKRIPGWRGVVATGHELANGFLYGAVNEDGLVPSWSMDAIEDEANDAESILDEICPGRPTRSFAYPCVRTMIGDGGLPIIEHIYVGSVMRLNEEALAPLTDSKRFRAIRVPHQGFNNPSSADPLKVSCLVGDGMDADSLATLAHIGISQSAWTVLVFGALRDNPLDLRGHEKFVAWLANCAARVRIDTFGGIAKLVGARQDVRI